jgi:hypothetical protein
MHNILRTISSVVALYIALHAANAAEIKLDQVATHNGSCEPSGAVALWQNTANPIFVIANDEDNTLRAYKGFSGHPLKMPSGDLNKFLGLHPEEDEDDKADLEGATWLNGKAYWIASHSRSGKGKLRKQRWQFFGTQIMPDADHLVVKPTAASASSDLLEALNAFDSRLERKIRLDVPSDEDLSPDAGGFNIEGLTSRSDGKSMFIGLRSPLGSNGRAILIPLENPEGVVERGEKPSLQRVVELDLNKRGVRSIEYSAAAGAYFIVAGPVGNEGSFDLYKWGASEKNPPVLIPGLAAALAKQKIGRFQPEALVVDLAGKQLQIFSDDGDICQSSDPRFRSIAVSLP